MKYYWARYIRSSRWFVIKAEDIGNGACIIWVVKDRDYVPARTKVVLGPEIPGPPEE